MDLPWAGESQAELLKVCAELKCRMTEQLLRLKGTYAVAIEQFKAHKIGSGDPGTGADTAARALAKARTTAQNQTLQSLGK